MADLVTADWHLTDNPRDEYRWQLFPRLKQVIAEHKVDRLLMLGDITEAKYEHSSELVNRFINSIYPLTDLCKIIVLKGNHDGPNPDSPFFRFIEAMPGFIWVQEPRIIDNDLFLPYTPDALEDWKDVDFEKDYRFAFTHQTFQDAQSDSGFVLDGINAKVFPGHYPVISGDLHTPQRVGHYITYVGAPYTVDFGDDFKPRFILIETRDHTPYRTSIPTELPCKRLLEVPHKGPKPPMYEGDLVKVRVHIKHEDYARWPEIRKEWREWGSRRGLHVVVVDPIIGAPDTSKAPHSRAMRSRSDTQIFSAFGSARGIDKATMETGGKLL